jgi:hypothetical protein
MNEGSIGSDFAEALDRAASMNYADCAKVADYALTILGLSVSSMCDDAINDNVNCINMFARGFIKFCGVAAGLSENDIGEAFRLFIIKGLGLGPMDAALHFDYSNEVLNTPEGTALFKAGQVAAWLCHEGNTSEAIAALGKALWV